MLTNIVKFIRFRMTKSYKFFLLLNIEYSSDLGRDLIKIGITLKFKTGKN